MKLQQRIKQKLRVEDECGNGVWIKSTRTLRQLIGVLGMLLPVLLYVFSFYCSSTPLGNLLAIIFTHVQEHFL